MDKAVSSIFFITFALGFCVFFVASVANPNMGMITLDPIGSFGYGFNTEKGAFAFKAGFAVTNEGWFKLILRDAIATMYVYDVIIYSDSLVQIEIPRNGTYVFNIPWLMCVDGFTEINETFHDTEPYMFDFTFVLSSRALYGPYRGPFEISWDQRLGFIHYPDGIWDSNKGNETG
jgi:hypothetical protein